jgi:hypothetical protein
MTEPSQFEAPVPADAQVPDVYSHDEAHPASSGVADSLVPDGVEIIVEKVE